VEPGQAVALAYRESRLRRDVRSSCGAEGPLQRIERYWPGDAVEAGLRAMAYYQRRYPQNWFCHYTGRGPTCKIPSRFGVKFAARQGTLHPKAR
jgi:hypothetical protein